jgi:hypothetical protein
MVNIVHKLTGKTLFALVIDEKPFMRGITAAIISPNIVYRFFSTELYRYLKKMS